MPRLKDFAATLLAVAATTPLLLAGPAWAKPARHHVRAEKVRKTHRILAGSKSIRINDAGEVITKGPP